MTVQKEEQVRLFVQGLCTIMIQDQRKFRSLSERMRVQRKLLAETAWQFRTAPEEVMEMVFEEFGMYFPHQQH